MNKKWVRALLIIAGLIIAAMVVYNIPYVHDRLAWRIEDLRVQIVYYFNPPDEVVFQPTQKAITPAIANTLRPSATPTATQTPGPTSAPTITPTPLPAAVDLEGDQFYVHQFERWNYCGPANLAMALKFWGWKGDRDDIARAIKPGESDPNKGFIDQGRTDRNVAPAEMVNYVAGQTEYNIVARHGGDIDLIKRFIAAGFPVMIEKGYYEKDYSGKIAWLGHYSFVTGYDDSQNSFIYQEAYPQPKTKSGKNWLVSYDHFVEGWRAFNYLFMVIYPPDREAEVTAILGSWNDNHWANLRALEIANREVNEFKDRGDNDEYFAWFNKGTSHTRLLEYEQAAQAYDQAFAIYAALNETDRQRPYRMMWYQEWPYWAYYFTGRYQDVINLANATLETVEPPTLEESIYWKAMAKYALGDSYNAIKDMRYAVYLNKSYLDALTQLQSWGVRP
jgi:uncharacterized protein YvpB